MSASNNTGSSTASGTGFLHQLAARSLGLAPQVKPRAALPYAITAPLAGEAEVAGIDMANPEAVAAPLPGRDVARHETTGHLPDALRPATEARHARQSANTVAGRPPMDDGERQPYSARAPLASAPPDPHREPSGDGTRDQAISEGLPQSRRPIPDTREATATHGVAEKDERSTARNESGATPIPDLESLVARLLAPRRNGLAAPAEPETQTEAQPTAPPSIARAETVTTRHPPAVLQPAALREAEAAPDIHITIGRLEVTAPSKPPPQAPARPRGPAPLSLSDYLARRHGSRS
jgi:hypothetical protein